MDQPIAWTYFQQQQRRSQQQLYLVPKLRCVHFYIVFVFCFCFLVTQLVTAVNVVAAN